IGTRYHECAGVDGVFYGNPTFHPFRSYGLGNVWNDGIRVPDVVRHFENRRDGARAADVAHLHEAVVTHLVKLAAEAVGFTRCFDRIQPFSYRRITRRM